MAKARAERSIPAYRSHRCAACDRAHRNRGSGLDVTARCRRSTTVYWYCQAGSVEPWTVRVACALVESLSGELNMSLLRVRVSHLRSLALIGWFSGIACCTPVVAVPAETIRLAHTQQARADSSDDCTWKEAGCMPSADEVKVALEGIKPQMADCLSTVRARTMGRSGLMLIVEFVSDGSVGAIQIPQHGELVRAETNEQSVRECIESVVGPVRLPPFHRRTFRVAFPYRAGG